MLLNKGDEPAIFDATRWLGESTWEDALAGGVLGISASGGTIAVDPHDVRVLLLRGLPDVPGLNDRLLRLQRNAERARP